jgi:hypothetical protein
MEEIEIHENCRERGRRGRKWMKGIVLAFHVIQ